MESDELNTLNEAIESQKAFLEHWRQPVEPLLFETLRAIDNVFCQELFFPAGAPGRMPAPQYSLSSWGVNKALARMVPDEFVDGPFRLFPSTATTQRQADEFLLQCGILEKTELFHGWITEGLVSARLDAPPRPLPSGIRQILVLKSDHPSVFREVIARKHRKWMSDLMVEFDRDWEKRLEERHFEILPELVKRVEVFGGWGICYSTTKEIDDYFLEWGQVYLRRMWSQDLVGLDDKLGGNEFREYLGVLAALSGRAQKHLCFASMLKRRHPELDIRNLLTAHSTFDEFLTGLAAHLNADTLQIQKLLESLTLGPSNRDIHTGSAETAWAPVVRSSWNSVILPLYGLEINPFLFLLRDLQAKYPKDWFKAANARETRWHADLKAIFRPERWIVSDRNLRLRDGAKTVTDIDFLAYDTRNNELAIFQLKWQHPVGMDNRARRSAAKNLTTEGSKWIEAVHGWLGKYGIAELCRRAGIVVKPDARARLFVIARYNAFFSGYDAPDDEAVWADWNHLMKVRLQSPHASVSDIAEALKTQAEDIVASFAGESYVVPIGDLAIVLNPAYEPEMPSERT